MANAYSESLMKGRCIHSLHHIIFTPCFAYPFKFATTDFAAIVFTDFFKFKYKLLQCWLVETEFYWSARTPAKA